MPNKKITLNIDSELLQSIDNEANFFIRNRSQQIIFILKEYYKKDKKKEG